MFIYKRKVQYYETDKMGITHHSNYIRWMEEARIAFLEHIGLPFQYVEEKGVSSPVAGLSIDYLSPSSFGDVIHISVDIAKYTGAKLEFNYSMKNTASSADIAAASSRHCFIKEGQLISLKRSEPEMHEILNRNTAHTN